MTHHFGSKLQPGAERGRLLTLEELMRQVPLGIFCDISERFGAIRSEMDSEAGKPAVLEPIVEKQRTDLHRIASTVKATAVVREYLPGAADALVRLAYETEAPGLNKYRLSQLLGDFCRRLHDDANRATLMLLDPGVVNFGKLPKSGWENAIEAFPPIEQDVIEAALCLTFERDTAAVFHSMRVLEYGPDKLRTMVRVPKKRPGWDGVIEAIDAKLKPVSGAARKSPAVRKRNQFIAEAVRHLRSVKELRNATMHDFTKTYVRSQAIDIVNGVRLFMQKMAEVA